MPQIAEPFRHEYDLDQVERIRPRGHEFEMFVTPRYVNHYVGQPYEAFTATLVGAMSTTHDLFVDIGAHYGFFSLVAASRNPSIELVTCEPVPETHDLLRRNLALNGLSEAAALRAAVSSHSGQSRFNRSLSSDNCSFYPHPVAPPIDQIDVETVTVDELLANRTPCPTLIKMDTDGHELAVLDGMAETLKHFPDLKLFVELNPKMQRLAGHEPEDLLAELERLGFELYVLDDQEGRSYRLTSLASWERLMRDPQSYANLYCVPRETSLSVCFVAHSAQRGGAQSSLLELVRELVEDHGAMCAVLLPDEGPAVRDLEASGAATLISRYSWWCDIPPVSGGAFRDEPTLMNGLMDDLGRLMDEPCSALRTIAPHAVVTHTITIPWGAFLASDLGIPHVWHVCEYGDRDHGFRFVAPFDEIAEFIRRSSSYVFTATDGIRHRLLPEAGEELGCTLYRHIDVSARSDARLPPELTAPALRPRIGVFGALSRAKGQDLVVEAVTLLKAESVELDLFLFGDPRGRFRAKIDQLVARHGLQNMVHIRDAVEEVYSVMSAMDIVVVGSRLEAFGRVAAEAMLLGKPLVYPRAGGPGEYVTDGETGLAYRPSDPASMAEAIRRLLEDPSLADRLGTEAQTRASVTFSRAAYGGKAALALQQLRGAPPPVPPFWGRMLARAGADRRNLDEETVLLRQRLAETQEVLQTIENGATWRATRWLRKPLDLAAPVGSWSRRVLKGAILEFRSGESPQR